MTLPPRPSIRERLRTAWHERALALKALSFALVGVLNTVIDFSVFWAGVTFGHLPIVPANVLSWTVAVSFSYAVNSLTTFGPESEMTDNGG